MLGAIISAITAILGPIVGIFNKKQIDVTQENSLATSVDIEQARTNQVEAGNQSLFVAGWRPYVGWMCALSLTYAWVIHMIISDIWFMLHGIALPVIDTSEIYAVLVGMLGIASLRTAEKLRGVTK